jgi:D-amino-acid dehydrogenase
MSRWFSPLAAWQEQDMSEKTLVVGGGVIGAACAYYLAKSGRHVTVVDRGGFGKACSHGNCGFVCPSHVLPLAQPGAIGPALKALLSRNAAFSIKPRFDPALWSWLFRFARRCNERDTLRAGRAIQALLNSSRALYDQLMRTEPLNCEWETRGLLFVFRSPAAMDHYAETDHLLRREFNVPAKRYDADAVAALEPALKPGLAGGWHYEADAHLRPDRLMSSWKQVLSARGVTIVEHCEVHGFRNERGRARCAITAQGDIPADAFVVAAGALTPLLGRELGCRIPIQPGKGYSITMPRPAHCPAIPLIFEEDRVAVTPMQTGYRLGSTMEFAGYDTTINRCRLELLRRGASHYLQEPVAEPILEEWYGWRPMTSDSIPIIDRSPALENVMIAAGHNMLGLSMAPATGKLVAELLTGVPQHVDPASYALRRF